MLSRLGIDEYPIRDELPCSGTIKADDDDDDKGMTSMFIKVRWQHLAHT